MLERDFNTISPSAKVLLMMKARTDIPFAKEAAALLKENHITEETPGIASRQKAFGYLVHFENRYRTIDDLLYSVHPNNILELSSGFSFRGLQLCTERSDVFYIDTDLPAFIELKKDLVDQLTAAYTISVKGNLLLQPLNAMNEEQFFSVVGKFPPGPVTIVNEGLLMYLDEEEKRLLCGTIHRVLKERGGCWITGDIYIKKEKTPADEKDNLYLTEFLEEHRVEDKKFENFEAAGAFFHSCGFSIKAKRQEVVEKLSALKLLKNIPFDPALLVPAFSHRQTWMLEVGE